MSYRIISIFIHNNILLRLSSRLTSAMFMQSQIPLLRLSPTPQVILVRVQSFSSFHILGRSCPNRHIAHELIWNPVSWNLTPKEEKLYFKVVQNMNITTTWINYLVFLQGKQSSKTSRYSWDPLYQGWAFGISVRFGFFWFFWFLVFVNCVPNTEPKYFGSIRFLLIRFGFY